MPKDWFAENPYPGLRLSEDVKHQLRDLVNGFLEGYFRKYEEFVSIDNRRVDEQRWKHLKSKDDLHVYEDRSCRESEHNMEPPCSPVISQSAPTKSDMPEMLRVGTVLGQGC
ncbi:hypothetical protein PF008_g17718 [Phytophthora fragariae]|uniref:Uncharacterized protein n=1 Tax=Phytophthora fragariae TaxID=53985 RepID=A0A6G0R7E9_9STRA|nr:hypothetical protein PF008_g17718 [Phytophthora fragariae]